MDLSFLTEYITQITWQQAVMWVIGGVLIFLAIYKKMEPTLLLPLGFGTILVNFPFSGAIGEHGPLTTLYEAVTEAADVGFKAENFVKNLGYMGSGMLGIFVVIGIIVGITYILNAITRKK